MWIVRLALNKPYTFIVAAILIVILGVYSIDTTPTDIFPNIDIPQITVIRSYSGLPAKEMEGSYARLSSHGRSPGQG
jgi:multidrug efflux pump subunit AcrB